MFDRRSAAALIDPHERMAAIVGRHGDLLLRIARGYSLCADDAHDAVQRGLEIYMRRVESLDPATELAWLKVVVIRAFVLSRQSRGIPSGTAMVGGPGRPEPSPPADLADQLWRGRRDGCQRPDRNTWP